MTSTAVVVIMSIIAIFTIPSQAGNDLDKYKSGNIPLHFSRCPPNETTNFDLLFYGSNSSTFNGCASLDLISHDDSLAEKTYSIKFGRLNNDGARSCMSGDTSTEHFVFTCHSQPPSPKVSNNGNLYLNWIYGQVIKPEGKNETRCAVFGMQKTIKGQFVMSLMAVSSNKSCDGLTRKLFKPHPKFSKVSMLLRFNRSRNNIRGRRSTSDDKNTIKNFSGV